MKIFKQWKCLSFYFKKGAYYTKINIINKKKGDGRESMFGCLHGFLFFLEGFTRVKFTNKIYENESTNEI